nr:ribonuclease H-like domain-containing protein [Tanacetum cinerariifolium]
MDLRWQMAMLTMRARRFLNKTRRKLTINGNETLGFDMSKVECYNCHKRRHFVRECRALRNQDTKHKNSTKKSMPVETPASIALVSCDGLKLQEVKIPSTRKAQERLCLWKHLLQQLWYHVMDLMVMIRVIKLKKGNPQMDLQDKGVIDSGCSRHMTGNMSYLTDYKEINGGYIAFGGNPKGGKITGKGTIRTGKLDFKNVYFVKELKFDLFSVSQMCDKKNSVLFNDTKCIFLSPNFKLIDESQVLLRVPRKKNMYSVDLKSIVPKEGLTCLFTKATSMNLNFGIEG